MKILIKKLVETAVVPTYAKMGDAGLDLTATSATYNSDGTVTYGTGLAMEIPYGYVGLLFPRSSISDVDLLLSNSVGVIDSGYRGEVKLKMKPIGLCKKFYSVGERVGQLIIIPIPSVEFELATELSKSERGTGGYGSTGR